MKYVTHCTALLQLNVVATVTVIMKVAYILTYYTRDILHKRALSYIGDWL